MKEFPTQDLIIVPQFFNDIREKLTIFCSCNYNELSYPLPIRRDMFIERNAVRAYGSVFISAVIKNILYPNEGNEDPVHFKDCLNEILNEMKKEFHEITKEQNSSGTNSSEDLKETKDINTFFDTTKEVPSLISPHSKLKLTNFNKLLLDNKYWGFDIRIVPKELYKDLKIADYINIGKELSALSNDDEEKLDDSYGPVYEKGKLEKLQEDFINCFHKTKEEMKLPIKDFEYKYWEGHYSADTICAFDLINDVVQYEVSWQFEDAYMWLIPYIKSYINRNIEYHKQLVQCFIKTIRKILEYWNDVIVHVDQDSI